MNPTVIILLAQAPDQRFLILFAYRPVEVEIQQASRDHNKPVKCRAQIQIKATADQVKELRRLIHKKLERHFSTNFYSVTLEQAKTAVDEAIAEIRKEEQMIERYGHPPFIG